MDVIRLISMYEELLELNLIDWPTLYIGFKKGLISKKDIEDYATLLLTEPSFFEQDIALLANATNYDENAIEDMLTKLFDLNSLIKENEIDKLKLAALLNIEKSPISNQEKCDKLQNLYADFDYPEDMADCSIYSTSPNISPLKAMNKLIFSLRGKFSAQTT
jgi:hypothetical protein